MGYKFNVFTGTLDEVGTGGSSSGIGGTIAATQVAYGTALDTIGGDAGLTYDDVEDELTLAGDFYFGATINQHWYLASLIVGVDLELNSGPGDVSHQSGDLIIASGAGVGNGTGPVSINTGADSGGASTGALILQSGASSNTGGISGDATFKTGSGNVRSGTVQIRTGNSPTRSGGIEIFPGSGAGIHGGVYCGNFDGSASLLVNDLGITATGSFVTGIVLGNGQALKTNTTTAHTGLIQAYDVDDAQYRTFGTGTNGNTPSWDWSAPAGGTLSGNFTTLQIGGTNVLTVSGSGTALTFPGTLSIASGKVLTASNTLTFTGTDSTSFAFPGTSDTVVALTATQTLTNKRITKRVVTASDATSITPNTDSADVTYQANTQAAGTLTINDDGGAPTNGQAWLLKIKSTSVQTFSWNSRYVGGTIALPTATTGTSKIDNYAFLYDTVNSKWEYTGTAGGF